MKEVMVGLRIRSQAFGQTIEAMLMQAMST